MLRFLTAGESHGKGVGVIIDGLPAGVDIDREHIRYELNKRKKGAGTGGRQLIEKDRFDILSGVRFGKTLGSPIHMHVPNDDFTNWGDKMSSEPQDPSFIEKLKVTNPRPGHADLAGVQKYDFDDVRNVLERASARETIASVMAGALCKQFLSQFGIQIASHTVQIGKAQLPDNCSYTFEDIAQTYEKDPEFRCVDPATSAKMKNAVDIACKEMNTLGGIAEIWAVNVPPGLGSYVQWDHRIDSDLAHALMGVRSVKAVEIGTIVNCVGGWGTDFHDEIYYAKKKGYYRKTNNAGGIEGGITNGMPVVCRVYHKPISTIYKPLHTVNIKTKEEVQATVERSDICIVPRGGVVSEAMVAYVLAKHMLEKFGGDTLNDVKHSYDRYMKRIGTAGF